MFRDNEYVANSAYIPHTKSHEHYIALSFHRFGETIDAGVISFRFLAGKDNSGIFCISTGVTNTYGKYYSPYYFGEVIPWTLHLGMTIPGIMMVSTILTLISI